MLTSKAFLAVTQFLKKYKTIRYRFVVMAFVMVAADVAIVLQPLFDSKTYALSGAVDLLLPKKDTTMGSKLSFNADKQLFHFSSADSSTSDGSKSLTTTPSVKADLHNDLGKGVTVTDTTKNVSLTLTPLFKHAIGKKDGNRIVYPLKSGSGWTVYTVGSTGLKEDVVLTTPDSQDTKTFSYNLSLGEGLISKLEVDGSLGIYGNTLLSGQITTGSDADAKLLEAARKNASKDTLLFTLPKPTIIETGKKKSSVTAHYQLNGTQLDVVTSGLKSASYPLSIDPTVLVTTASQFMAGNNETNINFDVSNQLIKKSPVTGARFNSWNSTTALPANPWASGAAATGGYVYSVGGISFQGQTFNSQGASSFIVPTGITSINVILWGGGGGGGGGAATSAGGIGGGAGALQSTLAVTPGETLSVYVGGGGGGGIYSSGGNSAGGGGGGGGFSSIYRGATALALVAGGGGAGGARSALAGGDGGAGGGTSGITGAAGGTTTPGGPGTASTGGSAGAGAATGIAGSSLAGGSGGDGRASQSSGSGVAGGGASGGNGGAPNLATTRAGGGGGGSGYFGGGGGGGTANSNSASGSGGGGGSSYSDSASTNITNSAGSGSVPGNSTNTNRSGAGTGGTAGIATGNGSIGAGGLIAISYGVASATSNTVNWAQFNTTTGTVDSTNPGSGTCSGWCTNSAYNLPSARSNFTLVAYSGFLYAFGGLDGTGTRTNTVYIAKLGANGEPRLWHPTSTDKTTWGFWYQDTSLSSIRSDMSVTAYNNRMYLVGGLSTGTSVLASVEIANINPNGTLGSWATSTPLPTTTYGHSAKIYNDRMYILGGATSIGGAPVATVQYIKINAVGTLNSWVATTSLPEGRMNNGGDFATVWGGYLYASGGCTTTNTSGYCSSTLSTTKVASLNTDGSLDTWSNMAGASDQRTGLNLLAWAGSIYEVGGCSIQNTTTGACSTSPSNTINYGTINQDGDVSSVSSSSASTTSTCAGITPTACNLPGVASIGNILTSSFIANGYLYVVGGCTNTACSTTTGNVAYVAISSTGQMSKPATCPNGAYQGSAWCVDTVNTITGGIAAASPVLFNNRVYLVGGLNGTANTNAVVYTTFNSDGSIVAWTSQSMTTLGLTAVSYLYAYARANPAAAGTTPGSLYVFGGCTTSSAASCTGYSQAVYKCDIQTAGAIANCTTTGQLQIGIIPGDTLSGIGVMSGAVYANYIYLIGGASPNQQNLTTVRYAKFDANNNIVTTGTGWTESSSKMVVGRRLAAAYAYNGYIYALGGYNTASGTLSDIEFIKINVSDGSIGTTGSTFTVSSVAITQRWGISVPISNSYAYVVGGCITGTAPTGCTAATDTIQSFQVYNNDSGAPAGYSTSATTWTTSPSRIGQASTILNGYLYVAGGCTGTVDCSSVVSNVSYAPIDVYGNIGTWSNTTSSLPAARAWGKLLAAGGTLYYVGGQDTNNTSQSTIYFGTPSSGNIGSWATASNGLPSSRTQFGATVWNNRLYVIDGLTNNIGTTNYTSAGKSTFVVPAGISSITAKVWGGGGGGGAGGSAAAGGTGAGGGYETATLAVTPGETLNTSVGGSGGGGSRNTAGFGGGGGGDSGIQRGTTSLIIAGAGAGGGGGGNTTGYTGGTGAPGGGLTGATGSTSNAQATGGLGGTQTAGGTGGPGGYCTGQTGGYLNGGNGADGLTTGACSTGTGGASAGSGFLTGGGLGGSVIATTRAGGGGAGSGYYGGGGGSSAGTTSGGGGGGGGSSYAVTGATNITNSAGSGINQGNSVDPLSGGLGGIAGIVATNGTGASSGALSISWSSNAVTSTVYVSPALTTGGDITSAWATNSTSPTVARSGNTVVAYANNLYLVGGYDGANYLSDVQYSQLSSTDGSAGTWQFSASLPTPLSDSSGFAANGYLYLMGGRSTATTCNPISLIAAISGNTTIASGNSPTGIGEWYQTNQKYSGARYGASALYNDGKAYIIGGACGSTLTYASPVIQQTTVLSQPQVAKYSIAIDTDSEVYPAYWLLNGVDNGIGASWQLRYRSMTNNGSTTCSSTAMTTWGAETIFGNVTLGLPGVYIPKDASGVSTGCARYYYFSVSVDSSQAFGYPDDVSRGPTITDLTLQFSADPSKRLIHGKTFTGGLQQPIDTPLYH